MWTSHRILIDKDCPVPNEKAISAQIRKAVRETLQMQDVMLPCEISVLLTDDAGIREINREQRGKDGATDVLSFPMFELAAGEKPDRAWAEPDTGLVMLGDMVLSLERVREQAKEYGHSRMRELCYLTVHSVLHLLGYDHLDEGIQKAQMRREEELVLSALGITREEERDDGN